MLVFLDQLISREECKKALFAMGLEKSLGWDGITARGVHSMICKIARANNIGVSNIKKTYIIYL